MINKLVLGTAQLGMVYGIGNKTGKPDFENACDIVKTSFDNGVVHFDTAQAYGDSEEVLGQVFDKFNIGMKVKIYSKLDSNLDLPDATIIQRSVEGSLRRLKVDQLEGLLLHNEEDLRFWDKGWGDMLRRLVDQGKVKSIGASFYTPQKALTALDIQGLDFIQIPANILDQRFEQMGVFKKASALGKEVFVRSILLQGLLLMPLDQVPIAMRYASPYLEQVEQIAREMKLSRKELVLGYASQRWGNAFVLFGAETKAQVLENVRSFSSKYEFNMVDDNFKKVPEEVLNPMLWPK